MKIEYDSNNSGGIFWLDKKDWLALEAAGWVVNWTPDRWHGQPATTATLECASEDEAIASFEAATGQDASAEGCPCCGPPHTFWEAEPTQEVGKWLKNRKC